MMKDIIKELRRQAASCASKNQDRYEIEILLKSEQASQIAAALEVAIYPAEVRAILSIIEYALTRYEWVAVDRIGNIFEYEYKPIISTRNGWGRSKGSYWSICNLPRRPEIDFETLLFHRTESGWEWIGKDQQELNK